MQFFVRAPAYAALPGPAYTWLIEGILPASGLLNIYGPPKAGKSKLTLHMCSAIADPSVGVFLKWSVLTHGPVWYFQLDTPRTLFQQTYVRRMINAGLNLNEVWIADREMDGFPFPFNLIQPASVAWLTKAIRQANPRPVAIVIDTLRKMHGGDENDSAVITNIMNILETALRIEEQGFSYKPAIILVSHEKKLAADAQISIQQGNRGSNAIAGAMDCSMRVGKNEIRVEGRALPEDVVHAKMLPSGKWIMDAKAMEAALTEEKVLGVLLGFGGALTHTQWEARAEELGVPKSTFGKTLKRIKDKGLVNHDGERYAPWELVHDVVGPPWT